MKYLVTGLVDVPGEGLRHMELVLVDVEPDEDPRKAFERNVRKSGLIPKELIEIQRAN